MKKIIFVSAILLLLHYVAHGQVSTQEKPLSFRIDVPALTASEQTQKLLPSLDMARALQEETAEIGSVGPFRFGYKHRVNFNLSNSGEWTELPNGSRIWRLTILSPGALSINLVYNEFWIPEGAKLWIYSTDRSHSIGAFTSANNTGTRNDMLGFATELIRGDQITLEYYLPSGVRDVGVISIVYAVHGYRNMAHFGWSDSRCQINVNCSTNWRNERNAVAKVIRGNTAFSGALLNTTANDFRPLFLTADHNLPGLDAINNNRPYLSNAIFYWHFESPGCNNAHPTGMRTTQGAWLEANNSLSDFALLRLNGNPVGTPGITPYFLGWDRTGNVGGTPGVGIHHPNADIKKISTTRSIQNLSTSLNVGGGVVFAPNTHWQVVWNSGITAAGSSGSPLINNNRRVIGQLTAGTSYCENMYTWWGQRIGGPNEPDWYGKFNVSWWGNTTNTHDPSIPYRRRLNHWLDPLGTSPLTLNGTDWSPALTGPHTICTSAEFRVINFPQGATVTWNVPTNATYTRLNNHTVRVNRNTSRPTGPGLVSATINLPGGVTRAVSPREVHVGPPNAQMTSTRYNLTTVASGVAFVDAVLYPGLSVGTNLHHIHTAEWQQVSNGNVTIYDNPPAVNVPNEMARVSAHFPGSNTRAQLQVRLWNQCGPSPQWTTIEYLRPPTGGGGNPTFPPLCPNCFGVGCSWCRDQGPPGSCGMFPCRCMIVWGAVHPNPADNILTIDLTQIEIENDAFSRTRTLSETVFYIRLFNAHGMIVRQQRTSAATIQFDVSNLPEGTYYLHIEHSGEIEKHQIIVQRN